MADKGNKYLVEFRKAKALQLAVNGMHPADIAVEMELNIDTINKYLDEGNQEARKSFENNGHILLARAYVRLEHLVDRLMSEISEKETINDGLALVDRVDKLINTEIKLIRGNQPITVKHEGQIDSNVTFHHNSKEYGRALELANEDPSYFINTPMFEERIIEQVYDDDFRD